jgi:2-oxoglutarate dehydrogenase E1 component
MKRSFRKPLIVMTPKSILRLPEVASPWDDFTKGGFKEVLDDAQVEAGKVKRVLLCTGKIAIELARGRGEKKITDVAIIRLEQLYPFHERMIKKVLEQYSKAKEFVWVQEEPQNSGAWFFVEPRFRDLGYPLACCSRDASASPAVGSHQMHEKEQKELLKVALSGSVPHLVKASVLFQAKPKTSANGAVTASKSATSTPA